MKKILPLLLAFCLVACSRPQGADNYASSVGDGVAAPAVEAAGKPSAPEGTQRRFIASKHSLTLMMPAAQLREQFNALKTNCLKLGCDILEAVEVSEVRHQDAYATLSARIPPHALDGYLGAAQSHAKLVAHQSSSEDKTTQVIDVEARIKNLEALRARVTELLTKHSGDMKEILEAEKQLSETQAELDSINGQRRALAQLTDMVRVDIRLEAASATSEGSFGAPVVRAVRESGSVLMSSLGTLITIVVAAFPWVVLLTLLVMGIRRLNQRRKRKAAARA